MLPLNCVKVNRLYLSDTIFSSTAWFIVENIQFLYILLWFRRICPQKPAKRGAPCKKYGQFVHFVWSLCVRAPVWACGASQRFSPSIRPAFLSAGNRCRPCSLELFSFWPPGSSPPPSTLQREPAINRWRPVNFWFLSAYLQKCRSRPSHAQSALDPDFSSRSLKAP